MGGMALASAGLKEVMREGRRVPSTSSEEGVGVGEEKRREGKRAFC
jgi:hypothetical protein